MLHRIEGFTESMDLLDQSFVTAQATPSFDQTEVSDENDAPVTHPRDTHIGKQSSHERNHRDVLR